VAKGRKYIRGIIIGNVIFRFQKRLCLDCYAVSNRCIERARGRALVPKLPDE
jgi:hypothetical protein